MERTDAPGSEKRPSLLIIIGDLHNEHQKELVLCDLECGLKSWNKVLASCSIQDELQKAIQNFQTSEEGPNGEQILAYSSENAIIEILINPQSKIATSRIKNFFITGGCYHHLIYSGIVIQSSGSWVLQDSLYHFSNFVDMFRSAEVTNAIKQSVIKDHVFFNLNAETEWTESQLSKFSTSLTFTLNATPSEDASSLQDFLAFLSRRIKVKNITDLLRASNVVGNIRFTRPTLYVFPGCQGDSSLFGISGFNLLINAGYSRKSAFWDFTRHLDRIDAMILTHLGPDNLFGISSVVTRKLEENLHPEIGCVFLNAISDLSKIVYSENDSSLTLSVTSESTKLVDKMKQIGLGARPCVGNLEGGNIRSVNLYHKVGHGSLDMYILNPMQDSKSLKDFLLAWSKGGNAFTSKSGLPLCNAVSVCTLLVWRPASFTDTITRLLFPGSASQDVLFEGLDRLKNMNLFQHSHCCEKDLIISKAPPGRRVPVKPSGAAKSNKSLSIPAAAMNSPKSEVSSPRSEYSSKDKKSSWPTRKDSGKESVAAVGNKKSQDKSKNKSEVQEIGEKFVAEGDDRNEKEISKVDCKDDGQSPSSPSKVDESGASEPVKEIVAEALASSKASEAEADLARHDSLENMVAPNNQKVAIDADASDSKDFFDAKALHEGLQGGANSFFGIEGKANEQSKAGSEVEDLEMPMSLPPPVRNATKQPNTATSPRKTVPPSSSQLGIRRMISEPDRSKSSSSPIKSNLSKLSRDAKKASTSRVGHKPATPIYIDLTYVPNHGDSKYVDLEFFKRVRARYYVFSTIGPDAGVLSALLEAKQTWDDPDLEVTIIPTYDAEVLRYWLAAHHEQLSQQRINVAPAANRCTIQLQDHETSCAAYRLEF